MNTYTINKATIKDSGLISKLICELLKDFNQRSGSNFMIDASKIEETCKELLPRDNFAGFIAINNITNETVGLITIAQGTAIYNGGDFGVITELYVDRNIRSNGIGKLLIKNALEFARTKNWSKVEVGAPNKDEWPRTIEFYKKNGFEEKGPKLRVSI
ncbi:GNAT family N-acetyltransferase [Flavobacterium taihuense]|uniref:GNAT family N-acetyltransferase n=1 Tax=Flavobacterium taihuense TaxID=2857508 RepID=A0ABS6Y1N3_9FLAO|nr:GNAT family N-acetyltransferase [Flavobacterium taihuense]MBW4362784.1 GNAT family N-acetyltransferase [Flavobacterium taihuense]